MTAPERAASMPRVASWAAASERVTAVRRRIAAAALRTGRDPEAVTVVAVTKTLPPAAVLAAVAAGLLDVGENYVQEARDKRAATAGCPARWHLIGGLQRNKVRLAVASFDRVHTVDAASLAVVLSDECRRAGRRLPVLLQVNVTADARKRGVTPDQAEGLAAEVLRQPGLRLDGFMTIGPQDADPAGLRAGFRTLREVRDGVQGRLGVELPHLSMGMSGDFEIAVEEGATLVRLGRVLFGERA